MGRQWTRPGSQRAPLGSRGPRSAARGQGSRAGPRVPSPRPPAQRGGHCCRDRRGHCAEGAAKAAAAAAALAPAGGGGGGEAAGGSTPSPPDTRGERQGQGRIRQETFTARETDAPTLRHTDTHSPGKQPPSVRLGTHRQLDTQADSRQPGNSARGRGKQRLLCLQRRTSAEASRRTAMGECAWGSGSEAGGRGCRPDARRWHRRAPPWRPDGARTQPFPGPQEVLRKLWEVGEAGAL